MLMTTRVLFVHGSGELAGLERVFLTLLDAIPRENVEPVVAALADGPVIDAVAERSEVVRLGSAPRLRHIASVPRAVQAVRSIARDHEPDVVVGNGEKMSVIAALAARRLDVPVSAWLHDTVAPLRRPAAVATQVALRTLDADSIVCCAQWLADAFGRRYRTEAIAIRNGLHLDTLPQPRSGRSRLLEATGWPDSAVIIAFVGRLQRWKGPELFLRAAATATSQLRGEDVRFVVIGGALFGREADFAADLPPLVSRLGIGGRVTFLGHRNDAIELMSGADVVAHCSIEPDPLPTVIMEGMALGTAVVATRTRGPEELIADGIDGRIVAPDASELARVFVELGSSVQARRHLGGAARATARDRFDARRMAKEFKEHWVSLHGSQTASEPC